MPHVLCRLGGGGDAGGSGSGSAPSGFRVPCLLPPSIRTDGRGHTILMFWWAKGSDLLIEIPLPIGTQTFWWYHIRLYICVWCPWLFEHVDSSLRSIAQLLNKDKARRRRCEAEVVQLLDPWDLLHLIAKKSVQSSVGKIVVPSSRETS